MKFVINGETRDFPTLIEPVTVSMLIAELALKGDRVAVEHKGEIVPRSSWTEAQLIEGDKLEIVHFVGGGVAG